MQVCCFALLWRVTLKVGKQNPVYAATLIFHVALLLNLKNMYIPMRHGWCSRQFIDGGFKNVRNIENISQDIYSV